MDSEHNNEYNGTTPSGNTPSGNAYSDKRPDGQVGDRPEGQSGDRGRGNRNRPHTRPGRRSDRAPSEVADGQSPEQGNVPGGQSRPPRPPKQHAPRPDRGSQRPRDTRPDEGADAPAAVPAQPREARTVWSSSGKGKRPGRPVAPSPAAVRPVKPVVPAPNAARSAAPTDTAPTGEQQLSVQERPAAPAQNGKRQSRPERPNRAKAPVPAVDTAPAQPAQPETVSPRMPGQRPPRMPHKAVKPADLPQMDNLLIEDTPAETASVPAGAYVPSQDEIDRILQTELSAPGVRRIPAVIPEGKLVIVGVRFRTGGKTYFFDPGDLHCQQGQHAIVDTARGLEYGEVCLSNRMVDEALVVQPLRPLVRIATQADIDHNRENHEKEAEAYRVCVQKIRVHKLDMKLVTAQYTFDNSKLLFYFTSAGRVDFRELVRDLASVFHIRIELRQIGIRDEARMIGGLGACGRPLCCSTFLSDFGQVSMKMAKEQNLSLNSSKISGVCGRLMCCLRYEYETYQEEIRRTPAPGTFVITPDGPGVVTEIYPLPGEVKVSLRAQPDVAPKRYKRTDVTLQSPGARPGAVAPAAEVGMTAHDADEEQETAPLPGESLPPRLDPDTPSEAVADEPDRDE